MGDEQIQHVTESALLTAGWREMESSRPDALFHDPLAARLAGERGLRIARSRPLGAWVVAIRTVLIDAFLRSAISSGIDMIIDLGAGWTPDRTGWISPRPSDGSRLTIRVSSSARPLS
jgi:O-methyltransferase involved in polyketide biosynthesis